ncbi:hypothetical protein JYT74_00265 [Crocinitomix catalasitica]|nr:hypothetical protein [Crocinitomix catalasitica]
MHTELFVPIVLFIAIFGAIYIYLTTRNKERLALIEKGADASLFERRQSQSLRTGMLLIGISVGIFMGHILEQYMSMEPPLPYFAMIALFGGGSLILHYFIERKLSHKNGV